MQSRLRSWINRDDGRFFRVDNRSISWPMIAGILALVGALILEQLRRVTSLSILWVAALGIFGFALVGIGAWLESRPGKG